MDYLSYFDLAAEPFSNAPLARFYYGSQQHTDALDRLRYAASTMKGLAILIGDIGLGKTTLARRMLESLPESEYEAALLVIVHAGITPNWLLKRIAIQLAVPEPADDKLTILSQLYQRLMEIYHAGKKAVVLIDEAQMLATRELMEEFRGLLNLEVPERKLISFIFFGLPEIEQNLRLDPPLAQRIALRYRLQPLVASDTHAYVRHRLTLAGASDGIFGAAALDEIHRFTHGVPRLINTLCDNLLLEMFFAKLKHAEPGLVENVASNLSLAPAQQIEPPITAPEPLVDLLAVEGSPGHDAIVAVDRSGSSELPPARPSIEPDAIAAQVAGEPMTDDGPSDAEAAESAPVVDAPVPVLPEHSAPEEDLALSLAAEADAPRMDSASDWTAETTMITTGHSVDVVDYGPPPTPLARVDETTVDIEDPLAFLGDAKIVSSPPPSSPPSPWQGGDEDSASAGRDALQDAPVQVVDVELEVEVEIDPTPIPLPGHDGVGTPAKKPVPVLKPAVVAAPAAVPAPAAAVQPPAPLKPPPAAAEKPTSVKTGGGKTIDLSEIDALLADLNLPKKK
ncbi:MAG: AAA family ATPase [Deltaproteobacteria bacterium]|nr:AAA family ATPase [Deltaproteobacteria bacterium]